MQNDVTKEIKAQQKQLNELLNNATKIKVGKILKQINPPKVDLANNKYCDWKCAHHDTISLECRLFSEPLRFSNAYNDADDCERCPQCHEFVKILEELKNEN